MNDTHVLIEAIFCRDKTGLRARDTGGVIIKSIVIVVDGKVEALCGRPSTTGDEQLEEIFLLFLFLLIGCILGKDDVRDETADSRRSFTLRVRVESP